MLFNTLYLKYTQVTATALHFYILSSKCSSNHVSSLWIFLNLLLPKALKQKHHKVRKKLWLCFELLPLFCFEISVLHLKLELWFPPRQNKEAGGWLTVEFICLVNCVLIWPTIHLLQILFKCKVILWSCFSFCFICVNIMPYELPWSFFLTAKKHTRFSFQGDWKPSNWLYIWNDLSEILSLTSCLNVYREYSFSFYW